MGNRQFTPLTKLEEDLHFGQRKYEIGKAFSFTNTAFNISHYYLQRENDVLHVHDTMINTLHVGHLNKQVELIEITPSEFENKMREVIYKLDINHYWGK
jgi:hypothetical protein